MKEYVISEQKLLSLLEDSARLTALENGGVDNWGWYSESLRNYVDSFSEEILPDNYWFEDVAEDLLKEYLDNETIHLKN